MRMEMVLGTYLLLCDAIGPFVLVQLGWGTAQVMFHLGW